MSVPDAALTAAVESWIADDPDPETTAELRTLLAHATAGDDGAAFELADRFSGRLEFGTAGLRAALGAGPMRMNRVVVRQAAAGLMQFLQASGIERPTVVIGYDARHKSDEFARDTARVVAAAGGRAMLLPTVVPTPLLAFAVRHHRADAGVMCTASHNPRVDNGYKVYLGDGAQIIPPVDAEIATCIDEVAGWPDAPPCARDDDPAIDHLDGTTSDSYKRHVITLSRPGPRTLSIVYTPMHGVGRDVAVDVLRRCGFADIHEVAAQAEPDPDFPTVAFPNPEEPGALDLALELARAKVADVVIANDPDADRMGVAVPAPTWEDAVDAAAEPVRRDRWTILSGNEIGALLADHMLAATAGADRLVVTTFVSSSLLAKLAADHGVHHREVLTGFKWVVRPAMIDPSLRFVFGFEEALGFSVDGYVRDKDGVSTAATFCELVAGLVAEQRTVWHRLEAIARRHGHHATRTWSVRFDDPGGVAHQRMHAAMDHLRSAGLTHVGDLAVVRVDDMARGTDLPPTDAVVLWLEDASRLVVRPSGTEPKIKVYAEVVLEVPAGQDGYRRVRHDGGQRIDALLAALARALDLNDTRATNR